MAYLKLLSMQPAAACMVNVPDPWQVKKVPPQKMMHLTEKPVEFVARAMQNLSRPGENVLDLLGAVAAL